MTIRKGGFEINKSITEQEGKAIRDQRREEGDSHYVPRCPDCASEGVYVMEGVGMCGSCPGWIYKFKANPNAGKTKIVNGDFVREAEFIYDERQGNHP